MILPLQTWQHRDPKGLWPAIGGLAVLAHIGVIGMSVPYLLSLREAEAQNAATAIPIELSVEPSTESAPTEAPPTETPVIETLAIENDKPAVSDRRAVVESAIAPQQVSFSARSHTSKPPPLESPSTPESTSEQPDNPAAPQEKSAENEADKAIEDSETSETPETPDDTSEPSDVIPENSSQPSDNSSGGIQEIASGDPLPLPPDNSQVGQSLRIRTVLSPEYDPAEGSTRPGPRPELIDTRDEWLLHPNEEGCGVVSTLTAQSTLTYRVGINPDGTIHEANLLLGQEIAPESEDAQAVACLIQKMGITFRRPGISEDDESIDDSLLMTFELSEE